MSFDLPVLVIFHGGTGSGAAEHMVAAARVIAARQTARAALGAGFEAVVVATDDPAAFAGLPSQVFVEVDAAQAKNQPFSLDVPLRKLVDRYGLRRPAVMGSGAVPLLGEAEFRLIAEQLVQRDACVVTNNFFSSDLTAWTPGELIAELQLFERDNQLPRRLRDDAGLSATVLPRTTATQFDLDTPADLCVLALQEFDSPLATHCRTLPLPTDRYRAVGRVMCDPKAELIVAGRAGSQAWQYLERETACRVRFISEERGMAAAGAGHRARSFLGYMVEDVGVTRLFERLGDMGDAAVIDCRVLEAHLGLHISREDRFQGDLYAADAIVDQTMRELVEAANAAPIPVLLGGHSLVSGGLMALNDAAWAEHDRLKG
jgi:hypothetical protein